MCQLRVAARCTAVRCIQRPPPGFSGFTPPDRLALALPVPGRRSRRSIPARQRCAHRPVSRFFRWIQAERNSTASAGRWGTRSCRRKRPAARGKRHGGRIMTDTTINPARTPADDGAERTEKREAAAGLTPFSDELRVPPVLRPGRKGARRGIDIELKTTWVRLHSQLPPTKVWAYAGHFPGPTIEVRRSERLRVTWVNRLTGGHPVTAAEAVPVPGAPLPTDVAGRADATLVAGVDRLPAWVVTHLHGAVTGGGNDGWSENAVAHGDAQLSEYPNDHRAAAWWYHDHAMDITRWNVFAGLAGMYLIRDEEEDALQLPSGEREIPLILQDRNLDTDEDGRLTGRLLHKTLVVGTDPQGKNVALPFSGPYTLVNGTIWPYADVEARWYRFRLLNAANARTFTLRLVDDRTGAPVTGAVHQIGSDGGLLPRPLPVDGGPLGRPRRADGSAHRLRQAARSYAAAGQRRAGCALSAGDAVPGGARRSPPTRSCCRPCSPRRSSGSPTTTFPRISTGWSSSPRRGRWATAHPEMWEMQEVERDAVPIPGDGVIQRQGRRRNGAHVPPRSPDVRRRVGLHGPLRRLGAVELPQPRRCRDAPDAHPPHRLPGPQPRHLSGGPAEPLRQGTRRHPGDHWSTAAAPRQPPATRAGRTSSRSRRDRW